MEISWRRHRAFHLGHAPNSDPRNDLGDRMAPQPTRPMGSGLKVPTAGPPTAQQEQPPPAGTNQCPAQQQEATTLTAEASPTLETGSKSIWFTTKFSSQSQKRSNQKPETRPRGRSPAPFHRSGHRDSSTGSRPPAAPTGWHTYLDHTPRTRNCWTESWTWKAARPRPNDLRTVLSLFNAFPEDALGTPQITLQAAALHTYTSRYTLSKIN